MKYNVKIIVEDQESILEDRGWCERPIDRTGIHVVPVRDHRSSPVPHLVGCSLRNGGVT